MLTVCKNKQTTQQQWFLLRASERRKKQRAQNIYGSFCSLHVQQFHCPQYENLHVLLFHHLAENLIFTIVILFKDYLIKPYNTMSTLEKHLSNFKFEKASKCRKLHITIHCVNWTIDIIFRNNISESVKKANHRIINIASIISIKNFTIIIFTIIMMVVIFISHQFTNLRQLLSLLELLNKQTSWVHFWILIKWLPLLPWPHYMGWINANPASKGTGLQILCADFLKIKSLPGKQRQGQPPT